MSKLPTEVILKSFFLAVTPNALAFLEYGISRLQGSQGAMEGSIAWSLLLMFPGVIAALILGGNAHNVNFGIVQIASFAIYFTVFFRIFHSRWSRRQLSRNR